jgi:hypothetical protein
MTISRLVAFCTLVLIVALAAVVSAQTLQPEMLAEFRQKTGLEPVEIPETQGFYMGKTHRGYPVLFTAKAGNVWGRYAARLTLGEIGREVGGFTAYITGQRGGVGEGIVGSPVDRLLSEYLGHPITLAMVLIHDKPAAPRLDVISDRVDVQPHARLPRRDKIGGNAGYIYADDASFAKRIAGNAALMKRLRNLRDQYIMLDDATVTLLFAGTELEYSQLIRNHGDYYKMLNALMDDLADIADAVPAAR